MKRAFAGRLVSFLVIAAFLVAALAGASVLGPAMTDIARAQSEPITTVNGVQLPPPVPGLDYDPVEAREKGVVEGAVTPATPTAPVYPADASTVIDAPDNGGALTTSLGGSDIAVSSVGGSYEVDSPKKRSNRKK